MEGRKKKEKKRRRRKSVEIFLHPTIKIHDFPDAFTESIPLIISNPIPSSHLFSSSVFISIFPSLEHMHLSIFLSFSIISIHLLLFISRTHTSCHLPMIFSLSPFISSFSSHEPTVFCYSLPRLSSSLSCHLFSLVHSVKKSHQY